MFPNSEVIVTILEISIAPQPDHNFPLAANFFATTENGLFLPRSQAMALLLLKRGFHYAWLRKPKVKASSHTEKQT